MGSEIKHTSGIWSWVRFPSNSNYDKPAKYARVFSGHDLIALVKSNDDAKLIAAAPELLAECQKQVVWLRHIMSTLPMRDSVRMGFEQSIKYLNAATTKATA